MVIPHKIFLTIQKIAQIYCLIVSELYEIQYTYVYQYLFFNIQFLLEFSKLFSGSAPVKVCELFQR